MMLVKTRRSRRTTVCRLSGNAVPLLFLITVLGILQVPGAWEGTLGPMGAICSRHPPSQRPVSIPAQSQDSKLDSSPTATPPSLPFRTASRYGLTSNATALLAPEPFSRHTSHQSHYPPEEAAKGTDTITISLPRNLRPRPTWRLHKDKYNPMWYSR
ncbi:hypothetical protein B0T25DRAFT_549845 [Lasiosphaeria hispida]|uniref:Uncharacterized protein n=1 Tax=Lasiosphaeria hispida TaxID=260671 RepID=A0AAJ0HGB1_9PEZI|nr:hypothetical protein B0T25DRAFT_549845 [Lasiosphaeria hispida]